LPVALSSAVVAAGIMEVPQVAKRDGLPPAVARLSEEPQRLVQVWLRVRQLPEPVVRDSDVLVGLRELRGIPGLLADREGRAVARERVFQLPMLIVNAREVVER